MKKQGACAITPAQLSEANITTCFFAIESSLEVGLSFI